MAGGIESNLRRPAASEFDVQPAMDVLRRILPPGRAEQFDLKLAKKLDGRDHYRIQTVDNRISVEGTSPAVILTGVHAYLKQVANVSITWNGDSASLLPTELPKPSDAISETAVVPHRYAGNETWTGYTNAYWSFEEWRHEIDVLAMNGINEILVLIGHVSVYYETFQKFGYTDAELREWMPPPAHQPWFHLQSMHTIMPLPKSIMDQQADLAREVIDYMWSLGMTPVFPGYFGMVPPRFAEKYPRAHVIPQGTYGPYDRVDQLDPTDECFAEIASTFYEVQRNLFGNTTMYNMNIVHEGGNPGITPIPLQAQAVQSALQRAHPGSIWIMLGWWHNPLRVVLDAIDKNHVLILDGMADITRVDPYAEFNGTPYAFGSIWNYGGRTYLRARMAAWVSKFHAWLNQPKSQLCGIAVLPEANDTNPAAFTLMAELAWKSEAVDFHEWIRRFPKYRYGGDDAHASEAWKVIGETAYALEMPPPGPLPVEKADPFVAAPDVADGAQVALNSLRYEDRFDRALDELLQVAPDLRESSAYRYDLLDIARQALANHAYEIHGNMCIAYKGDNLDDFIRLSGTWLRWMKLLDALLGTNVQTMLGRYLECTRWWGDTDDDRALARYDALCLVTIWAPRNGLHDYAGRGWHGLTGGYYYDRWDLYIQEVKVAMKEDRSPQSFDWHEWGLNWIKKDGDLRTAAAGNVIDIAHEVLEQILQVKTSTV